ncbi:hypothetical protein ACOMHN_051531 [Nucella lapillus]
MTQTQRHKVLRGQDHPQLLEQVIRRLSNDWALLMICQVETRRKLLDVDPPGCSPDPLHCDFLQPLNKAQETRTKRSQIIVQEDALVARLLFQRLFLLRHLAQEQNGRTFS